MDWNDKKSELTRKEAIQLLDVITGKDDPYWSDVVDDFYDEETDSWPTIYHVMAALGITKEEYDTVNKY